MYGTQLPPDIQFRAFFRPVRTSAVCAAAAAAFALQACGGGGDGGDASDNTATVAFRPDAATCVKSTWQLSMYIDGTLVGVESVNVGDTSSAYTTSAGLKALTAVETRSGLKFGPMNEELLPGEAFTRAALFDMSRIGHTTAPTFHVQRSH